MTDNRPLESAYAKLDWATLHLRAMVEALDQFQAESDRGSALTLEFDTRVKPRGRILVRFKLDRPIPIAISLQAGDVVHNARVALDHMVAALKAVGNGSPRDSMLANGGYVNNQREIQNRYRVGVTRSVTRRSICAETQRRAEHRLSWPERQSSPPHLAAD